MIAISSIELQQFITAVKSHSGYDFSEYSDKSLKRRVAKILTDYKMDLPGLIAQIKNDKQQVEKVVKDVTVNTTELFRDPNIWQLLKHSVLPKLAHQSTINIWHAGCSTGQEVYSMLMVLNELNLLEKARIYASDLNTDVLDAAQKGIYKYRFNASYLDNFDKVLKENPLNYDDFRDVPYSKYFEIDKTKDIIKMNSFLAEKPIFKKHDLVRDGNIFYVKFDIIICRNVIIYFNYALQNKIFDLFYNNLYNNGILWLGMHESIMGPFAGKFEKNNQFYHKKEVVFSI
ncbi:MAG: CheR family methyltransferase [Bacteroidota bacterium]|nr:CheR family methyltransferase [Bacteroidota bacterium]